MRHFHLIATLLLLFAASSALADECQQELSKLQVRGEALLEVPADEVRLSIGVSTAGKTADVVLQQNSRALKKVETALREAGLETGEYSTGRFSLQPNWSPRPRAAVADWQPEIVGYTATNSLQLRSGKLAQVGNWISVASKAGANEIGQIVFALADPRLHREAALREATANALADARALAEAAGVKLVRVLQLQLDPPGAVPLFTRAEPAMLRTMAAEAAPPIVAPDDLQVQAGVSITWQITE
jgi:uncharacterized protein YggE